MNRLASLVLILLLGLAAHANEKPNVLFISIDDLNDYISPLDNHPNIVTPHFERLAKRSVTFTNAHCASPACHPSRVAVMTGVHPVKSGIYRNLFRAHGPRWRHESKVLENAVVLSQHFRDHGYHAAGGGKIFHTLQWTPGDSQNDPDAWDEYRGDPLDPISADWPRPASTLVDQNEGFVGTRPLSNHYLGAAVIEEPDETHGDHLVVDWALEKLNEKRDEPLFLAVGLFRPHIPFEVSQRWFDLYPMDKVELPPYRADDLDDAHPHGRVSWHKWVTENKKWKHLMRGYLASISYVDHQVGRLLDGLDQSGLKENTIVVLWTDHGFHIGEKDNWEKFALWEQTTRVPLFIHAPGVSQDGQSTRQPTTLTDLYPTLCELAGLPVPKQCTGTSLVSRLKSPAETDGRTSLTSFVWNEDNNTTDVASHGLSSEKWRYIKHANGREELYDLIHDRNEFTNLAEDPKYAEIKQGFQKHLPEQPAMNVKIPVDSPYHGGRSRSNTKSPNIANRPLNLSFEVTPDPARPDGVIASHGGEFHGYSIYVKQGQLVFAVRHNKELFEIQSDAPGEGPFVVEARLKKDGSLLLAIDGEEVAKGKAPGLITNRPNEGALLRDDDQSPVGKYSTPFPYRGQVKNASPAK